jgi:chemotaxis protein methyltransferase CheR
MTALDALGTRAKFALSASDIDSKVLASAAQGVYKIESMKGVESARVQKYFMRGKGANEGMARVKPEVRGLIEFLMVNLISDDWPFKEAFDVVFCRNVMIYFDAHTQRLVLERIHRVMKPGALLFVGHAENFSDSRDLFVLKGKTVYERR